MNCNDYLYGASGPRVNSRRWFLKECGLGLGKIAAASLLADAFVRPSRAATVSATEALQLRARDARINVPLDLPHRVQLLRRENGDRKSTRLNSSHQ